MRQFALCYGSPSAGTSTVLRTLCAATEQDVNIVEYPLSTQWFSELARAQRVVEDKTTAWTLIDVPGGLVTPGDVKAAYDSGLLDAGKGAIVRIHASPDDCMRRAPQDYVDMRTLLDWQREIVQVENRIRECRIRYYMVANDSLEHAVVRLAAALHIYD